jgi:RNA polymerase sigma-70 factor (ECF subfamily)
LITTATTIGEGAVLERTSDASTAAEQVQQQRRRRVEFDQLVALHEPRVRRLTHRLLGWSGAAADVDDVVQDVFLVLLDKLNTFRGDSSLATWLARVTINACRSHQRRKWLRLRWLAATHRPPHFSEAVPPADEKALREEASAHVRDAVAALKAQDREVIVLFYLEELPVREIAALLGVSNNVVEVRLHRARERLKAKLTDPSDANVK